MKEVKFISKYVLQHSWKYLLGLMALFAVDLMQVYIPEYTGMITDGLESGTITMDGVINLVGKIVLIGAIIAFGRFLWRYFIFGSSRSIEKELRNDMFGHLEKMSMQD